MTTKDIYDQNSRPHLVILGAGATMATIPNGDKNGLISSVMDNLINNLGLKQHLNGIKLNTNSTNLEDIYSELYERKDCTELRQILEEELRNYFSKLQLPDKPTIYDTMVLSLRKKDSIASFNWDPLLLEAFDRVSYITDDLPELIFLHGNVNAGICLKDKHYGVLSNNCPKCNNKFQQTPLLYPIKNKDYISDIFIKEQWEVIRQYLEKALIVTIFGYGAPKTDQGAINLLQEGYGSSLRYFDEVEIIDKCKTEQMLFDTWNHFHTKSHGHLKIYRDFSESYISKYPRRSVEARSKQNKGWWNKTPLSLKPFYNSFEELENDFRITIENEYIS